MMKRKKRANSKSRPNFPIQTCFIEEETSGNVTPPEFPFSTTVSVWPPRKKINDERVRIAVGSVEACKKRGKFPGRPKIKCFDQTRRDLEKFIWGIFSRISGK
jgi:hypothetical protein